ncbi:MAG: secretion protein HlyD [Hyphomonas sp.]|nr:secretion protein HlyD [Hyphomonas sp.]
MPAAGRISTKRIFIVAAVLVAALVLGRFVVWPRLNSAGSGADGALVLYGNVDIRQVELAFRVSGRLDVVNFEEGDTVSAGDVIAVLDIAPLRDGVAQAEAEASVRRAELARLEAGSRSQEIDRARARVEELDANVLIAQQTFDRQSKLRDSGYVSQQAYDTALATLDAARKRLVAAKKDMALVQLGPRAEEIAGGTAGVEAAEAAVAQAQLRLGDTSLVAPSDGVLLARVREPGSIVAAGVPVATLALTSPVWVRAYVDETDLGFVVPGRVAEVFTDSAPGKPYKGQVGFVSPIAEFTPRTVQTPDLRTDLVYQVRITVDAPDSGLRQGMPVTVKLRRTAAAD